MDKEGTSSVSVHSIGDLEVVSRTSPTSQMFLDFIRGFAKYRAVPMMANPGHIIPTNLETDSRIFNSAEKTTEEGWVCL